MKSSDERENKIVPAPSALRVLAVVGCIPAAGLIGYHCIDQRISEEVGLVRQLVKGLNEPNTGCLFQGEEVDTGLPHWQKILNDEVPYKVTATVVGSTKEQKTNELFFALSSSNWNQADLASAITDLSKKCSEAALTSQEVSVTLP